MPRPNVGREYVGVRLDADQYLTLTQFTELYNISMSEAIRLTVDNGLVRTEKQLKALDAKKSKVAA